MIGILDYGLGNLRAFSNALANEKCGSKLISDPDDLENISKIILPGVASYDGAITKLREAKFVEAISEAVCIKKVPVLGVCVGMQILASTSDEGQENGLGWINGSVKSFLTDGDNRSSVPVPHMGWNSVSVDNDCPLFLGISDPKFYFLHSYYFKCAEERHSVATVEYTKRFTCAVQKENIFGVQFHPEKSHHWGQKVLSNFARL